MRWINVKKEKFISLECINSKIDKYIIRLSPNSKNIDKGEMEDVDTRIISIIVNNKPTITDIKNNLLYLQKEYDNSKEVNVFVVNNKKVWLDKATRVGLFNVLNLEKDNNVKDTTLWLGNNSFTLEVDKAIKLLTTVELYAKQCFDVTQKHYNEIKELSSIEDALQYDVTKDYPNILNIQID